VNPELAKVTALGVHLRGRRIGIINRLAGDRYIFAFEQDYVDDPSRPTLSLSYKGQSGGLVTAVRAIGRRLPPFFANLLPEGHLRTYLAEKAGVKPEREFYLMAVLGGDVAGAVTLQPLDAGGYDGDRPHGSSDVREEGQTQTGVLRFSLAGVQLKFSAVAEASGGLTIPAHGVGGSWIVKLPSPQFPAVAENEYAMLELARSVGIVVPAIKLVRVADIQGLPPDTVRLEGHALAIERFDRAPGGRIHMEDFAQVFGLFPEDKYGSRSYANIAAVLWAETGDTGAYEFMRRLVFSVVIGNGDMHLKNWSLLYPDGRTPVLSPAYDFVATLPYIPGDSLALTFGRSKSLHGITLDQVLRFTDKARMPMDPVWRIVHETVERTEAAWRVLPEKDLLPTDMRKAIDRQILAVAAQTGRKR
jgi:serine/threonine-protein kinase HipA